MNTAPTTHPNSPAHTGRIPAEQEDALTVPENRAARQVALRAVRILLHESAGDYSSHACKTALEAALAENEESISSTGAHPAPLQATALRYLHHEIRGMGALENLLSIPHLTDIYVNGPANIWVQAAGQTRPVNLTLGNETRVRSLAQRLIRAHGGRLDTTHPAADVQDGHGRRIHALTPPLAARTHLSIRISPPQRRTLNELRHAGMFTAATEGTLRNMIADKRSFIISGGTGTGKTTLLNAMLALCPPGERLITLEDTPELSPAHPHVVPLYTRRPNTEGTGEINLGELIVQALRMAPDRLIIGECRGAEITHLLTAMNTGHSGAGTSLHANSAQAVPLRLAALGALAGLDAHTVHLHAATAFERIIHLRKDGAARRIEGIYELFLDGKELAVRPLPVTESAPQQKPEDTAENTVKHPHTAQPGHTTGTGRRFYVA